MFSGSILASLYPVRRRNIPFRVPKEYQEYEFIIKNMNLLYITADAKSHYVLVKDLSRLALREYNNGNNKRYFCQYCCVASPMKRY